MPEKRLPKKHPDLIIYEQYPRKVARLDALKAIAKAAKQIAKDEKCTPLAARRKIYRAVVAYAKSPQGQNPDRNMIPHPATWFNRGSYMDDPLEWQYLSNESSSHRTLAPASVKLIETEFKL